MRQVQLASLLDQVLLVARGAGEAIMSVYEAGTAMVTGKSDGTPLTEADQAAHRIIAERLAALLPDCPVVSEEDTGSLTLPPGARRFWLVDPLDGTKEFIGRNGEFTVNIALIEEGLPVLGVVFAPALNQLYAGVIGQLALVEDALGRRPVSVRPCPVEGLTVVGSRSHGDPMSLQTFLEGKKVAAIRSAGSSLKLCMVAAGEADLYPRLGQTMEWDIAAGHAVLAAAGGSVCDLEGNPLTYGKPGWENPHFVAIGQPSDSTRTG